PPGPSPVLAREGPGYLRSGGAPADRRHGPALRVRRGPAGRDTGPGPGAHRPLGLLVRAPPRHRPEPLHLHGPGDVSPRRPRTAADAGRPVDARAPAPADRHRV